MSLRVLHITSWYPNDNNPSEAIFVKEHVEALAPHCHNHVVHFHLAERPRHFNKVISKRISDHEEAHFIHTRAKPWRIKEQIVFRHLKRLLRRKQVNQQYDLVNFHVAFPNCAKVQKLQQLLSIPMVITEHWTAYHLNFGMPKDTTKLDRIKHIFHHGVKVITVSEALANDIAQFAGTAINYEVVPNVVSEHIQLPERIEVPQHPTFFMLNNWRPLKKPFVLIKAFQALLKQYPNAQLKIGGFGPLWNDMVAYVEEQGLQNNVQLLGRLTKEEVATAMHHVTAFIHATAYETFSVVCAEAICSGTPVAVTHIPAVAEFINPSNGMLVARNEQADWEAALQQMVQQEYDRATISREALQRFSKVAVGQRYWEVLKATVASYKSVK